MEGNNKNISKKKQKEIIKQIKKAEYNIFVLKKSIKKGTNYIIDFENRMVRILKFKAQERNYNLIYMYREKNSIKAKEINLLKEQLQVELNKITDLLLLQQEFPKLKTNTKNLVIKIHKKNALEKKQKKAKRKEIKKARKAIFLANLITKKAKKEEENKLMKDFEIFDDFVEYKEQEAFNVFMNYLEERDQEIENFEQVIEDADYKKKF